MVRARERRPLRVLFRYGLRSDVALAGRAVALIVMITHMALVLTAPAQAQCPNFGAPENFVVGTNPRSVAIGDFNGDGRSDLAVANGNSNNVSILLGTETGTFGAATNFAAGMTPISVAIGDFNGDERSDLAVANYNSNDVSVLLGSGTGTFGGATSVAVGASPFSVAIGDFNGDGRSDLAVANGNSNHVSILLGTGTGTFGAASNLLVEASPRSVAIGDFSGDGLSDLAVANYGSNDVSILLGTGTGTFAAPADFAVGTNPIFLAIGDFNGDGLSDLAVANANSNDVSVLLGAGTGMLGEVTNVAVGASPFSVAIGDLNGDGRSDLAVANFISNNVSILLGTGTGAFGAATNIAVGASPASVTIGDYNSDGRGDIAVANSAAFVPGDYSSSSVAILLNSTAPCTLALSSSTYSVSETVGFVTITVNRTGGTDCSVTVDYSTANASADAGTDYIPSSGTINFAPGATSATFTVPIIDDTLHESDETFSVALANPTGGATLGVTNAAITIFDQDPLPVATSTTISASRDVSTAGSRVIFTAHVTAAAGQLPTGTVTFLDGNVFLGRSEVTSDGSASFGIAVLTIGSHAITAEYDGDADHLGSTSSELVHTVTRVEAEAVRFNFTGAIVSTFGVPNAGSTVSGYIIFDPSTPLSYACGPDCAGYPQAAPSRFFFETNSGFALQQPLTAINIADKFASGITDYYVFDADVGSSPELSRLELTLSNNSNPIIADTSIPTAAPDISAFQFRTVSFFVFDSSGPTQRIHAVLTSLTTAPASPSISTVSPSLGAASGGELVTITGTNLTPVQSVKIGSQDATITSASATSLQATAPRATTFGVVDVSVTTPGGTAVATAAYTIAPPGTVITVDGLHGAILDANSGFCPEPCTITFQLPLPAPAGGYGFNVTTDLPSVTASNVTIDGFANGMGTPNTNPLGLPDNSVHSIVLEWGWHALELEGEGITIRGLAFRNIDGDAISVRGSRARVSGNRFADGYYAPWRGMRIHATAIGTIVGGTAPEDRNVFMGAGSGGIVIDGSEGEVIGNQFGNPWDTGIDDDWLATTYWGISLERNARANHIGRPGHGNVFALFEAEAMWIAGNDNFVQGNRFVGGDSGRRSGPYINIYSDARGNWIGGTGPGEGNEFRLGPAALSIASWEGGPVDGGNVIAGNAFTGNDVAIDLGQDGSTPNDPDDADSGPHGLQNTPVLTGAAVRGSDLVVGFSVDSSAVATTGSLLVELYKADVAEAPQGVQSISYQCFAGNEIANAVVTLPAGAVAVGDSVVALATSFSDANCTVVAEGTSEFSMKRAVTAAPSIVASGPTTFCAGGSVSLAASQLAGTAYVWRRDGVDTGSGATYIATADGSYRVVVTTADGFVIESEPLAVTVLPLPPAPTITTALSTGSATLTAHTDPSVVAPALTWYRDGITVEIGSSLTTTVSGTFVVTLTDANGCTSTSAPASVTITHSSQGGSFTAEGVTIATSSFPDGTILSVTASPDPGDIPEAPLGYYALRASDGITLLMAYDIDASAAATSRIDLVFELAPGLAPAIDDFKSLRSLKILHGELDPATQQVVLRDRTVRYEFKAATATEPMVRRIYASVTSLSPFLLAYVLGPTIDPIEAPSDPAPVQTSLDFSATFTDPTFDTPLAGDVFTAQWNWGDGTSSAGTVVAPLRYADGTESLGRVTGSHSYVTPGVYTVTLTVSDGTEARGSASVTHQYIVVYDPSGGFVTGGGWIESPPGSYVANAAVSGKSTFGFVSRYQRGAAVPTGNTQFHFATAGFRFESTVYEWLVVAGAKAQYKGSGTVGGVGDYGFLLTATDGQVTGGGGTDKFRLKVWEKGSGAVVYDNNLGNADGAEPSTALGGGSIVIHH
jgi:hypothetical protein